MPIWGKIIFSIVSLAALTGMWWGWCGLAIALTEWRDNPTPGIWHWAFLSVVLALAIIITFFGMVVNGHMWLGN